jgi:regulator of sigma E protease
MSYVLAFIGLVLLIILHEGGHFVAAKAVGMPVERFALFFGPLIFKRRIGETEYGIGTIPLGGYVRIGGMVPGEEPVDGPGLDRGYYSQPVWKRIVAIAAGPAMNIILTFLLAWIFLLVTPQVTATTTVHSVLHGTPAAAVLKPGDKIVAVGGKRGGEASLRTQIERHRCAGVQKDGCLAATPVDLLVRRGSQDLTLQIRPRYDAQLQSMAIGVEFGTVSTRVGGGAAARDGASWMWEVTSKTVAVIGGIFHARNRRQISSIVGVYRVSQQQIAQSTDNVLYIMALISLSLAIVNLLPFLPLDGGHIFWALVEKVRGRAVTALTMERASLVGIVLIGALFVIGLGNDISSLAHGGSLTR